MRKVDDTDISQYPVKKYKLVYVLLVGIVVGFSYKKHTFFVFFVKQNYIFDSFPVTPNVLLKCPLNGAWTYNIRWGLIRININYVWFCTESKDWEEHTM